MADCYCGSAEGYGGIIDARIRVDGGKITETAISGLKETKGIGDLALTELSARFTSENTWNVDAVSGATITCTGARYAVRDAMANAGLIEQETETEETETDVVVVGCGVSGITAGVSAAERGLRVVMLERSEVWGGNGLHAHGGYFVETYLQKEAGERLTLKAAYDEAMFFNNYLCDPILMRRYLGEGAETVRWLNQDHGANISLPRVRKSPQEEGKPLTYHAWDQERTIWKALRAELEADKKVQIRFGVKADSLIMDDTGAVCGVVAKKLGGGRLRIRAGAVYLGTGGYLGNADMVRDALGGAISKNLIVDTAVFCDGSGIRMAWAAGAGKRNENMLTNHGGRSGLGGKDGLLGVDLLLYIPILWVNRHGQRFMDEEIVQNALFFSNLLLTQKGYAFVVFDQASLDRWKTGRIPLKMAFWDRFSDDYYCPPVTAFDEDFAEAAGAGSAFKAGSLEELAASAGMDPRALSKTVADYNRFILEKNDTEFCKSPESLIFSVEKGPFYAIRCRVQAQGTVGGVRISDRMQAVTPEGQVIPGLYVGGADAGGLYNGSYSVQGGTAVAWALTSGRIAGEEMAKYVKLKAPNENQTVKQATGPAAGQNI